MCMSEDGAVRKLNAKKPDTDPRAAHKYLHTIKHATLFNSCMLVCDTAHT